MFSILKENGNTIGSQFLTVSENTKNTENTKSGKQVQFSKNTKIMFFVFSKTVFNNNFQKPKPRRFNVSI